MDERKAFENLLGEIGEKFRKRFFKSEKKKRKDYLGDEGREREREALPRNLNKRTTTRELRESQ